MKGSSVWIAVFLLCMLFIPTLTSGRQIRRLHSRHRHHHSSARHGTVVNTDQANWERRPLGQQRKPDTLQVAGSRLPDCSHACGSCSPCRLVMVSFVCASLAEAETCPIAYKCMCKNKSYPVP
ncbi:protein EPIDERMAL PATTERNING FACTOR 1 [Malania oleifera]|uniref:protein EPIDERMAL PATTERNING FACTOR 1 n=1 Tax=Malania oleifera TaxID=397392 RepID=UPI0025AE2B6D|nr:protein EPIDERMAL PATTERNING FACTOR 1 [Malania oleifera]